MIVDTHVHPVAADQERYPLHPAEGEDWFKDGPMPAETFLEHMARAGVDQAVLVQAFTAHGYDNSYAADCAAKYPDKFVAAGRVDPLAPGAAETLTYWAKERGVGDIRLGMDTPEEIGHPRTLPIWLRAEQLRITVSVQLAGEARRSGLPALGGLLARFPGVNIVLDHLAHAPALDLAALARHPNLYLKFSSLNIREVPDPRHSERSEESRRGAVREYFHRLFDDYGASRIIWGSDFPHSKGDYADLVALARETLAFLSAEDQEKALAGTARRLYPGLAR